MEKTKGLRDAPAYAEVSAGRSLKFGGLKHRA